MSIHKGIFLPGSEWLYYKIYCGPKTADLLLTNEILPLMEEFVEIGSISKWFFIRYADPDLHLRLRLHLNEQRHFNSFIQRILKPLEYFVSKELIWKVELSTYSRETARYGINTIELSESLFHLDSLLMAKFLGLIEGDEGDKLRWLFGLKAIDNLLTVFGYDLSQKHTLLNRLKTGFGIEFGMSRPLKKQLDDKYRQERKQIAEFIRLEKNDIMEYNPLIDILTHFRNGAKIVVHEINDIESSGNLQVYKDQLLESYIHMQMNRLFKSKNRLNEMVIYDFLYRYYNSELAKKKAQN